MQRLSRAVCLHAIRLPLYRRASSIGAYIPIQNEVDCRLLLDHAHRTGKAIFLPVISVDQQLRMVRFRPGDPLRRGPFGTREPLEGPDRTPARSLPDMILLPLVGFDRRGVRLGYGGGYYDRLLARFRGSARRPWRVGLAYGFQAVPSLVPGPRDVPLDGVVTEHGIHRCGYRDSRGATFTRMRRGG